MEPSENEADDADDSSDPFDAASDEGDASALSFVIGDVTKPQTAEGSAAVVVHCVGEFQFTGYVLFLT